MFAKSVIAFAAAAALVKAAPVEKRGAPANWAWGYLEDYDTYHVRYLALSCQTQHNTQFFDDCCHPLLSTESLSSRPSYCTPSDAATQSVKASLAGNSGAAATSTASADAEAESEYCETDSATAATAAPTTAAPAAATPKASSTTTSDAGEQKWAQPSTTTTQAWTQAPTTTQAPKTTQAAATQQASSGGGGQYQGGYATYFYQGGNAGACGTVHGDYDMIVAIDKDQWGSSGYGSGSSTCGRWLTITNTNNGKSVSAMVADVCPTCANSNSLDLSVGAFQAIASLGEGQVPISWSWN